MKETIGIRLTEILAKHVDFYLAEAETEDYPYAVYSSSITPVYCKDGIHHYQAIVTITVYAKDLDAVNPICANIKSSIDDAMSQDGYTARLTGDTPDCYEGIWSRALGYTINQYQ